MPSLRKAGVAARAGSLLRSRVTRPESFARAAGALLTAIVVGVTAALLWYERAHTLATAQRDLFNLSQALAEHATRTLEAVDLTLKAEIAQLQDTASPLDDPEQLERSLRAIASGLPFVSSLSVFNAAGDVRIASSDPQDAPVTIAGLRKLKPDTAPRFAGAHLYGPVRAGANGSWVLLFTRRFKDTINGRGTVVAAIDPHYLTSLYKVIDIGQDASIALYTTNGSLVAVHPWRDEWIGKTPENLPASATGTPVAAVGARGSAPFLPHEADVLTARTAVTGLPLSISVTNKRAVVLSGWYRQALWSGTATALIAALVIAFTVLLERYIRRREDLFARLRDNEAELTEAHRIARLGSWSQDPDNGNILWSPQSAHLFGAAPAVLSTIDRLLERIHAEDRPRVAHAWEALRQGRDIDVEFRTAPAGSQTRWLRLRAEQAVLGSGGPARTRGTLLDVTDEHRAEEALQHLAAIVASTDDAIFSLGLDGRVLSWNRGAARMFGISAREALGHYLTDLLPREQAAETQRLITRVTDGVSLENYESKLELRDGREVYVAATLSPLRDGAERVVAVSVVARDVSATRRAQTRTRLEHAVSRELAALGDTRRALGTVLRIVAESMGWSRAICWTRRSEDDALSVSANWSRVAGAEGPLNPSPLPAEVPADIEQTLRSGRIGWHTDTYERDPGGQQHRPRSALLLPLMMGGQTLGIARFESDQRLDPDPAWLQTLGTVGNQLGVFLERKRAEAAVRESEGRFRSLAGLSSDWYWEQDADYRYIAMSAGAARSGINATDFIGRRLWEVAHVTLSSAARDTLFKALERRRSYHDLELQVVEPGNSVRYIVVSGEPVSDDSGALRGYRGVARDITQRREAEVRNAMAHAVARLLAESAAADETVPRIIECMCASLSWDCGVQWESDPDTGTFRRAGAWRRNDAELDGFLAQLPAASATGGTAPLSEVGRDGEPIWITDLTRVARYEFAGAARAGLLSAFLVPISLGSRVDSVLEFFSRRLHRPNPELAFSARTIGAQVGQFLERKRAEQAERQANERLRGIAANIPGIVFEYRLQADGRAAFTFVSEHALDILEEEPAALMADARRMFRLVEPRHRARLLRSMHVSRHSRALWLTEIPIRTRSGRQRWVRGQSMPEYLPDGSVVWDGVIVDVTAQKQAEQAIQQMNEQLERRVHERTAQLSIANRELESFAYSVSHDLRAPLRSIDGFARILLDEYGERFDATATDYLNRMRNASQRMGHLIDDLLSLSKLSRAELKRTRTDLSALAAEVAQELRASHPERSVEVRIDPGMVCMADPNLLRIALENLLGNAWKFTAARAPARIELGSLQRRGKTVYYCRDNGAGFDMKHAGKLFGAFQRLHSAREFEGSGIGLATVARIVDRHGGEVWAEAAIERGATFFFTLSDQGAKT